MKPLEFRESHYPEVIQKLVKGLLQSYMVVFINLVLIFIQGNGEVDNRRRYMYVSETEAVNSTHERWCQSKELIKNNCINIVKIIQEMKI
jgi:hypothetical protein